MYEKLPQFLGGSIPIFYGEYIYTRSELDEVESIAVLICEFISYPSLFDYTNSTKFNNVELHILKAKAIIALNQIHAFAIMTSKLTISCIAKKTKTWYCWAGVKQCLMM